MIYLDYAATSFPKSASVATAITDYLSNGSNPGRSGHRLATWAEEQITLARTRVNDFLRGPGPDHVTFGLNATMALNTVVNHLANRGGRVLISSFEHNSVTRPLHASFLAGKLTYEVAPPSEGSALDLDWLAKELDRGDVTGVITTWASNVTGAVLPVEDISELCRAREVFFCIDAAQAVGYADVDASLCDVLVFAGHKGLGGPQGVGGAVIGASVSLDSFVSGGSGGRSESPSQPRWLPWSQEAGTANGPGIAGLSAALDGFTHRDLSERGQRLDGLRNQLIEGLSGLRGVRIIDGATAGRPTPVVSFVAEHVATSTVGERLEEGFDVLVRSGLHCAPLAHSSLGTLSTGTVRMSLGAFTEEGDIAQAVAAVDEIVTNSGTAVFA
jgi:cysteine desulfurase/selenocysteine lyase